MKSKILMGLLALGLALTGCTTKTAKCDKGLTVGLGPKYAVAGMENNYKPVTAYLSKELNCPVEVIIFKDFKSFENSLKNGDVDMAVVRPSNYNTLKENVPGMNYLVSVATADVSGKISPYYDSYFVTLKKSKLNTLDSLKDKTIVFTSPDSISGGLAPLEYLKNHGIAPDKYFKKVIYLQGSHADALKMLIDGKADVCVVMGAVLRKMEKRYGHIFMPVEKLGPFAGYPIVATSSMDKNQQKEVIDLLLKMSPRDLISSGVVEGFKKSDESIYMQKKETKNLDVKK